MRDSLAKLYHGRSKAALRFRFALIAFDGVVIATFVVTTIVGLPPWLLAIDLVLAVVVIGDLAARLWIDKDRGGFLRDPLNWTDFVVALSLIAPALFGTLAFLRILRALRIFRSYQVLRELRQDSRLFRRHEEVIQRSVNLVVFVFVVSAFVYEVQVDRNPHISNYTDAIYFTVSALTTTGFGDIVLTGEFGRWLSIAILVFGVGLFLRLIQSIFRPPKVRHKCPDCGLALHEPDAVHCKHCGSELRIPTEGEVG